MNLLGWSFGNAYLRLDNRSSSLVYTFLICYELSDSNSYYDLLVYSSYYKSLDFSGVLGSILIKFLPLVSFISI